MIEPYPQMKPVEYQCDDLVAIRRSFGRKSSSLNDRPDWWYIHRLMVVTDENLSNFERKGLNIAYWNGDGWAGHTPRQFPTADAAHAEYVEKIANK